MGATPVPDTAFVSRKLSSKLSSQLDDVFSLFPHALPPWVNLVISLFPNVLSLEVRRKFLDITCTPWQRALYNMQKQLTARGGAGGVVSSISLETHKLLVKNRTLLLHYAQKGDSSFFAPCFLLFSSLFFSSLFLFILFFSLLFSFSLFSFFSFSLFFSSLFLLNIFSFSSTHTRTHTLIHTYIYTHTHTFFYNQGCVNLSRSQQTFESNLQVRPAQGLDRRPNSSLWFHRRCSGGRWVCGATITLSLRLVKPLSP